MTHDSEILILMFPRRIDAGIRDLQSRHAEMLIRLTRPAHGRARRRRDLAADGEIVVHRQARLDVFGEPPGRINCRMDIQEA